MYHSWDFKRLDDKIILIINLQVSWFCIQVFNSQGKGQITIPSLYLSCFCLLPLSLPCPLRKKLMRRLLKQIVIHFHSFLQSSKYTQIIIMIFILLSLQLLSSSTALSLWWVESASVQISALWSVTTLNWTPGLKCRRLNTVRDKWQALFSMGVSMWLEGVMIILEKDWKLWRSTTHSPMSGRWSHPCAWVEGHLVCI